MDGSISGWVGAVRYKWVTWCGLKVYSIELLMVQCLITVKYGGIHDHMQEVN